MDMNHFEYARHRREWHPVDLVLSGGPSRVVTNEPDPKFVKAPLGFTRPDFVLCPLCGENLRRCGCSVPLVWEGDQA